MSKVHRGRYRREYYATHKEQVQAKNKKWRVKNWIKVQAKQREYQRNRYNTDPEFRTRKLRIGKESYRRRYARGYFHLHTVQMKQRARSRLRSAIKSGKVTKPDRCDHCSQYRFLNGHHHMGYDKPFKVLWLCASCHGIIHRTNPAP